ncbi:TIGR03618 family F420-dependent PPOX class oxidoreductase [Rubrobacter tropicus]|uniref:TIGR03618 family F420-dependent PPOX class oxidoreductase n=1 Tax=Rubrobacter tropicus TaxID=2653851 RepID=A0A6G8QFC4_9ACTN|nr:PPOX class F420-dependent oxidoreductase [Rubrobacter tropicus]QIN85101.1 TIGR03618 family F420-dependent PPOX class oxidoreductase [Rubrobacter tropicus]
MNAEEYRDFLLGRARTAKLATVRADGRPHVAPVWYDLDGETFVFMTGEGTVKGRNMRREPRVSLCIDDERPPFHFVIVEGIAELTEGDPDLLRWATSIGGRYMGEDQAEAFGRRNAVPGELLVRVRPTKVLAYMNIAD